MTTYIIKVTRKVADEIDFEKRHHLVLDKEIYRMIKEGDILKFATIDNGTFYRHVINEYSYFVGVVDVLTDYIVIGFKCHSFIGR